MNATSGRRGRFPRRWLAVGLLALVVAGAAVWLSQRRGRTPTVEPPRAQGYFAIALDRLSVSGGQMPGEILAEEWSADRPYPYVRVEGNAEAYLTRVNGQPMVVGRGPLGKALVGRMFLPQGKGAMLSLGFAVPPGTGGGDAREAFFQGKEAWHEERAKHRLAGQAWFAWNAVKARKALGEGATTRPADAAALVETMQWPREALLVREGALASTRPVALETRAATVEVGSLEGPAGSRTAPAVSVRPATDTLAQFIPADQHAVFLPSFAALVTALEETDRTLSSLGEGVLTEAADARLVGWYQRQLCLPLSGVNRLAAPRVIESVAITGSDLNFAGGTDVAILFESRDPAALHKLLSAQIALSRQLVPGVEAVEGGIGTMRYTGSRSADRSVCAYLLPMGRAVAVSNSLAQLRRLAAVHGGEMASLAGSADYHYFRERYRLDAEEETALAVVPEGAWRRWMGGRWRIGESRRMRAANLLALMQAEHLDALAAAQRPVVTELGEEEELGRLFLTAQGVHSSVYGGLSFLTPVVELEFAKATGAEAEAYRQWRGARQGDIDRLVTALGARVWIKPGQISVDGSALWPGGATAAMPWLDLLRGARFRPEAIDPHEALAHGAVAINTQSAVAQRIGELGAGLRVDLLGWLGQTTSVYVDESAFWREMAASGDSRGFLSANWHRLPVALNAEVTSPWRLRLALAAVRAMADVQSEPPVTWQDRRHGEQAYVRLMPSAGIRKRFGLPAESALYYAAMPDALVISPNEQVLREAMERGALRAQGRMPSMHRRWLSRTAGMQIERKAVDVLGGAFAAETRWYLAGRAWRNLPILNEWRQRYPGQDPVEMHERLWNVRLLCPGEGRFAWSEPWQMIESSAYGHPAAPKAGPALPGIVQGIEFVNLGLEFDAQGVRVRVMVDRKGPGGGGR